MSGYHPIVDAFDRIENIVTNFITGGYTALANELSPAIYAGFTLLVIGMGFVYLRTGRFNLVDMAIRLMKGAIIVMLATQWGVFSTWVFNGLWAIHTHLGGTLVTAMGGGVTASSVNAIEDAFFAYSDGASALMSRAVGMPPNLPALASAIMLWISGMLFIGYAAFLYFFSTIAFATTFVLAPLFIPFAFFEATRDVLGAWARTVIGFVMIPVLSAVVLAFGLSVMHDLITQASTGNVNMMDAAITLLLAIGFWLILRQVPTIAGGMVGTIGVSGAGGMADMFMRPIARAMTGAPILSRWMRDRAAVRWGDAVERGRQRAHARQLAKAKQG